MIIDSIALGIALAMDAFSVSIANGLCEPLMTKTKSIKISGTFGFFQALMPLIGWFCVHNLLSIFNEIEPFIPWVAFISLLFLGIKMIKEAIEGTESEAVNDSTLLFQGIATSIDALAVGFTIAKYNTIEALISAGIIGIITMLLCLIGLLLGKKLGTKLTKGANILGGSILIIIGIRILVESFL